MAEYTRDGKIVIDLTMRSRTDWMTTRENFVKDDFLAVKSGVKQLESTREGASALQHLKAGEKLNEAEKTLLKKNLGAFAENGPAVAAVQQWVKTNGDRLPEALLRSEGRPLFQSDIRDAAKRLADAKNSETAVATMRDIESGKTVADAARKDAFRAFREAGLLTGRDELTATGKLLMKEEGKGFLAGAGVKTVAAAAAPAASAAHTVEEAAHVAATSSSFLKGAGKAVAKKVPLIGTALGVVAMVSSKANISQIHTVK